MHAGDTTADRNKSPDFQPFPNFLLATVADLKDSARLNGLDLCGMSVAVYNLDEDLVRPQLALAA